MAMMLLKVVVMLRLLLLVPVAGQTIRRVGRIRVRARTRRSTVAIVLLHDRAALVAWLRLQQAAC